MHRKIRTLYKFSANCGKLNYANLTQHLLLPNKLTLVKIHIIQQQSGYHLNTCSYYRSYVCTASHPTNAKPKHSTGKNLRFSHVLYDAEPHKKFSNIEQHSRIPESTL